VEILLKILDYSPKQDDPLIFYSSQYEAISYPTNESQNRNKIKIVIMYIDGNFLLALILPPMKNTAKARIIMFDPEGINDKISQKYRDHLVKRLHGEHGFKFEKGGYVIKHSPKKSGWPQQQDKSSCGVFVCLYALKLFQICRRNTDMWNHSDKELSNTLHLKEESCAVFNVHRYRLFMMSVIMKECEPKNKSSPDDVEKPTMKACEPKRKSSPDDVEKTPTSNPQSDNHALLHKEVSSVHTNQANARKVSSVHTDQANARTKLRSHTCIQSAPISKIPAFREVNESSVSSTLDTSSDTMTSPSTFENQPREQLRFLQ